MTIPSQDNEQNFAVEEQTVEEVNVEETIDETTTETTEPEVDYTPFLEEISKKAKYNKEPLKAESLDQVIENFQKRC